VGKHFINNILNNMKVIDYNKQIHDKVSNKYNKNHTEIYNDIEQNRIKEVVQYISDNVEDNS